MSGRSFWAVRLFLRSFEAVRPASSTLHLQDVQLNSQNPSMMVLLTATDRMVAALEAVPDSQRSELNLPATLQLHEPITHEQLLRLAKHLQNDAAYQSATTTTTADEHSRTTVLNTLLYGTKVYIPPPPKKPEPVRPVLRMTILQSSILTHPNRAPNTSPQKRVSSPKPKRQLTSAS